MVRVSRLQEERQPGDDPGDDEDRCEFDLSSSGDVLVCQKLTHETTAGHVEKTNDRWVCNAVLTDNAMDAR